MNKIELNMRFADHNAAEVQHLRAALTEISIELTHRPEDQSCVEAIRALKDQVRVLENRLRSKVGIESRVTALEEIIREAAQHDSWRCREYQECHCGLDEMTDAVGLPRIPYPPKG